MRNRCSRLQGSIIKAHPGRWRAHPQIDLWVDHDRLGLHVANPCQPAQDRVMPCKTA